MKIQKIASLFLAMGVIASLAAAGTARAATPTLSLAGTGDGDSVQVTVNGDANASVVLYYTKTNAGPQLSYLGNTNSSGYYSTNVSSDSLNIASNSSVYVTVNGSASATSAWPNVSTTGVFSLSKTGVTLSVNQSASITAYNNGSSPIYLSNNSNPPIANVNISGNQITIAANSYGNTIVTLCTQNSASTSGTNCASVYVLVQNSGAQPLNFSINTVTVSPGQNVPITISGGTGIYSVLNNSNPSAIQTSLSGAIITLSTAATSGTSAITVCSSDMQSCGIINATAGTASTAPLSFNNFNPVLSLGQSMNILISGGSATNYYISANTNATSVQASISGTTLNLIGQSNGTAAITVCSSSGSCNTLNATVNYTSSGGALQLSQTTMSLLAGQVLSVTISGGTTPYTLGSIAGNIFQAALNGNVLTVSGIGPGTSPLSICSAMGACVSLTVIVNSSVSGTPLTFSQNNLSVAVGGTATVNITGAGGYYVSNSTNQPVASVLISGNTATISGNTAGTTNVSICQSGGQCAILFVTVGTNTQTNANPVFSLSNPTVGIGQAVSVTISGGSSNNYYISANSNPAAATLNLSGSTLNITGSAAGSSSAVICTSSSSCSTLSITVTNAAPNPLTLTPSNVSLMVGQAPLIAISGNGGYYLSNNGNPSAASLQINGNTATVTGLAAGTANMSICQTGGQCATLAVTVSAAENSAPPAGNTGNFPSGSLVNDNGTIYLVAGQKKFAFTSMAAFTGLGYSLANVVKGSTSGYAQSDTLLKSAAQIHPDGSWILSGRVVFYVSASGYIPVPTWDVFLNNGGDAKYLVKANTADIVDSRPIISAMTENDSRVQK